MAKKEVIICDKCNKQVGTCVCEGCKKDICGDCIRGMPIQIYNTEVGKIKMCVDCRGLAIECLNEDGMLVNYEVGIDKLKAILLKKMMTYKLENEVDG